MLTALQRLSHQVLTGSLKKSKATQPLPTSPRRATDQLQVHHPRSVRVPGINPRLTGLLSSSAHLQGALAAIQKAPDEQSLQDARANFRVAIRALGLPALHNLSEDIKQEMAATGDFRTQRFLDQLSQDVHLERYEKGADLQPAPVTAPPLPGHTPEGIVSGSLKQLHSDASEANFRTTLAGFRVAVRELDLEALQQVRTLLGSAMATSEDYRTQLMLNSVNNALTEELIHRGVSSPNTPPQMPPVLSTRPQLMVKDALQLLHKNMTQSQFKTALAAVRVSARNLSAQHIEQLRALFQAETRNPAHDYRTQLFLHQAMLSLV